MLVVIVLLKDAILVFSHCPSCSEFYEPNALMMEEEGAIIAGLLVGLNVIDANFCMKGEDLDSQVSAVQLMRFSAHLNCNNSTCCYL